MDKMLKENPHGLVKFQVYSTKGETTYEDRRLNRVKTKNAIPFGPWAKMIVESRSTPKIFTVQFLNPLKINNFYKKNYFLKKVLFEKSC